MSEQKEPISGTSVFSHALRDQARLWNELLKMAAAVDSMFGMSVMAVCDGRLDLVDDVRARERTIDSWEVRVERECFRILALYEPVATDLRRLGAALRINSDLERISNLARNIAKRTKKIAKESYRLPEPNPMTPLALAARTQVARSLAALTDTDADLARTIIAGDAEVDRLYRGLLDRLKNSIRQDPDQLDLWLRLISTARNLERVADHATEIARSVIYIKEGDFVRHTDTPVRDS